MKWLQNPLCAIALAAAVWPAAATDMPCLKGKQAELVRASDLFAALKSVWSGPQCAQVGRVVAQLQARPVQGGRKLQGAKALDAEAARKELEAARADPEFTRKVAAASEGVTDPTARLVVETALLEDEGHFSASQLLMDEIAAKTQGAR